MDLLSIFARRLRLIAPLPPTLIGRWFALVAQGRPLQPDIANAPPVRREVGIAVSAHYSIGIVLALIYLLASSPLGLDARNMAIAIGFALCTNVFPWFLMFPAMGYGWFGLRGPRNTRLFGSSVAAHCFYGLGLWFGALLVLR